MAGLSEKKKNELRALIESELPVEAFITTIDRDKKIGVATWYDFNGVTLSDADDAEEQNFIEECILKIIARKEGVNIENPVFDHAGNGHFVVAFDIV